MEICTNSELHIAMVPCLHQRNVLIKRNLWERRSVAVRLRGAIFRHVFFGVQSNDNNSKTAQVLTLILAWNWLSSQRAASTQRLHSFKFTPVNKSHSQHSVVAQGSNCTWFNLTFLKFQLIVYLVVHERPGVGSCCAFYPQVLWSRPRLGWDSKHETTWRSWWLLQSRDI